MIDTTHSSKTFHEIHVHVKKRYNPLGIDLKANEKVIY